MIRRAIKCTCKIQLYDFEDGNSDDNSESKPFTVKQRIHHERLGHSEKGMMRIAVLAIAVLLLGIATVACAHIRDTLQ